MAANFIASNVPATFGEAVDSFKCVPFLPAFSCLAEVSVLVVVVLQAS